VISSAYSFFFFWRGFKINSPIHHAKLARHIELHRPLGKELTKAMQITVNEWSAGIGLDKEVAEPSEQGESESITPDEAVDVSEGPEAKRRRCGNP